ncbi:MAG: GNAT family N-acetyltransferase [Thermoactinospora sp.]|nr:GNAT family N-acetyltransferase [Thermoactinospora sp.]
MIDYTDDPSTLDPAMLEGFFVGWPAAPSPEQHLAVLCGSFRSIVALDGGKVVGFVNMISDGVLTAFIPWLEVLPGYQGQGIGAELMRRVLEGSERFYSVDLLCDEELRPYYEKLGMLRVPGMTLRHRSALAR